MSRRRTKVFPCFSSSREHVGVANTIEITGRMTKARSEREELHVRTRRGASIAYDSLWRLGKLRESPNYNAKTHPLMEGNPAASAAPVCLPIPEPWTLDSMLTQIADFHFDKDSVQEPSILR